ncbi:uncharacterized protein LOC144093857 isoform X2 [Amblyomma americanum]
MSSGEEAAAPFHGTFTKDILYELHRRQPHRFHFMTKFNAKSASWKDFELVVLDGELRDFARCVHCKNFVSYSSKKGTGSMLRHRCHAKESYFTAEEHNRFREMELYMRTPQPVPMGLSSQFVPRIKVELPEPPESPLRRLHTDCGGVVGLGNCDDSPLDVRIHPRSPNGTSSASNGGGVGGCAKATPTTTTVGGAPMVDNGEVEEIVANVELADDSTGDVLDDRNSGSGGAAAAAAAGRMPYASARAVAERQLAELQRIHAEEEHKLRVELLKKQHAVTDLQRKYWRMKVKAFAQKIHHGDKKSIEEDDSDSAD